MKLRVALHTYSDWETGKRIPSHKHRTQIVAFFRLKQEEADALFRAAGEVSPEINNIPFPQNPFFTGREAKLKQLKQLLIENKSVAITQPVSISGLGGIGKTQLALEYAHRRYPEVYRAVFWVEAADRTMLQSGYDRIAHDLELPERDERDSEQRVQAVKRWLEGHDKWLLILDNADDLYLARAFLPAKPSGHIVVTTRSQFVSALGTRAMHIEIEAMEPEEGLLFLLKRASIVQNEADIATLAPDILDTAIELATMLGGHPLALDQAGAYLEETSVSVADYIQLYQESRRSLLKRRGSAQSNYGDHPDSVTATIEISAEKACEQHPMAADILYFCSLLQPDAIPEELLHQDDDLQLDIKSFNEGVAALQRYSLIKRSIQEKTLSMHRLVQTVLLDSMSPDLRNQWRRRVVRALNAAFPEVEFKEWSKCERLVWHVLVCATWTEHELTSTPELAELLQKAGDYLRERGQYAEAEPLFVRAVTIQEQYLGTEHPDTARSLNNLAILYSEQGKFDLAEPLYLRAFAIREQHLDSQHPDIAHTLNSLATLYQQQGKYDLAEPLYQRAIAIFEQQMETENPHTARSLNNLAILYRRQSKYEQAEPLYQRALAIREQQLGPLHPSTARSLEALALLYHQQDKYDLVEPLYQRALTIFEQQLGLEHPDTARCLNNLADLYRRQGKYEQAELLLQRALSIKEQHLGTEHPSTAHSLHGLADLYQQQNKYEQAEILYRRALVLMDNRNDRSN